MLDWPAAAGPGCADARQHVQRAVHDPVLQQQQQGGHGGRHQAQAPQHAVHPLVDVGQAHADLDRHGVPAFAETLAAEEHGLSIGAADAAQHGLLWRQHCRLQIASAQRRGRRGLFSVDHDLEVVIGVRGLKRRIDVRQGGLHGAFDTRDLQRFEQLVGVFHQFAFDERFHQVVHRHARQQPLHRKDERQAQDEAERNAPAQGVHGSACSEKT
jgi:hypothetical protein